MSVTSQDVGIKLDASRLSLKGSFPGCHFSGNKAWLGYVMVTGVSARLELKAHHRHRRRKKENRKSRRGC
jgi:hypothetical protein